MNQKHHTVRAYQAMFRHIAQKHGRTTAEVARQIYFCSRSGKENGPFGMMHDGVHWFFDRLKDLAFQCSMSVSTVQRALKILIHQGYIFARKFFTLTRSHMKFYRWNWQKDTDVTPVTPVPPKDPPPNPKCKILDMVNLNKTYIQRDLILKKEKKDISKNTSPNPTEAFLRATQNSIMSVTTHFKRGNFKRSVEEQGYTQRLKNWVKKVSHDELTTPDQETKFMGSIKDMLDTSPPYQELCDIWNKHLSEKSGLQAVDSKTIAAIEEVWDSYFKGSISSFERFCKLLCSSRYIMSETFSITLASALKLSFLDKVKAGGLGVNLSVIKDPTIRYSALEAAPDTQNPNYEQNSEQAQNLQTRAKDIVGDIAYKSWLADAPIKCIDGIWKFTTTSAFRRQKWNTDPRLEQLRREGHLDVY